MKAKKLKKLIRNGMFGEGLTADQENGAKSSFLANLLAFKNVSMPLQTIMAEKSRARKLDMLLSILGDCRLEMSVDDVKKAHCAMQTAWARAVVSVCLGFSRKTLTSVGLPAGYIAPLKAQVAEPKPE